MCLHCNHQRQQQICSWGANLICKWLKEVVNFIINPLVCIKHVHCKTMQTSRLWYHEFVKINWLDLIIRLWGNWWKRQTSYHFGIKIDQTCYMPWNIDVSSIQNNWFQKFKPWNFFVYICFLSQAVVGTEYSLLLYMDP